MNKVERDFNTIMTSDTTGVIACMIAKQTGVTPYEAFRNFLTSDTYRQFRNPKSYKNNWGAAQIVKDYLQSVRPLD